MFSLLLSLLLSYSSLVATKNLSHENTLSSKSIFLLAGQSNMSGRGGVINGTWDRFVPPECQPNPSILRLDAGLKWEEAKEPLHNDIDVTKVCGIGPGMAFANSILERDSSIGTIGLVPCAVGGTNITEWSRESGLYNQMVRRAEAAVQGGGMVWGILWYQGESDTLSKEDAMLYRTRLEKFFTDVRSDLQSPSLPIIQVAIASGVGQYIDIIRETQLENQLPRVASVDSKGLKLEPDGLHLSTAAQVQLGEMLADAFLRIMGSPAHSNAPEKSHNFLFRWFRQLQLMIDSLAAAEINILHQI